MNFRGQKLVVISHTGHQQTETGEYVGWGPTINELNFMAQFWEEVVHVACLEQGPPKGSSLPYTQSNIQIAPIPPFGGKKITQKADILWKGPRILQTVSRALKGATDVQLRVPMGIGIYLLPYFALQYRPTYRLWIKYANNWGHPNPPIGYGLQRWFLKKNFARCKVTINGFWPGQPAHCLSFENPCLTEEEVKINRLAAEQKKYSPPYRLVFIGRLEAAKGIFELLDALRTVMDSDRVSRIDFIGGGPLEDQIDRQMQATGIPYALHGFLAKKEVFEILRRSHFLCLPSHSEGFPKVIAEAASFGCIPVVSNVGSIAHYVHSGRNGWVWNYEGPKDYGLVLADALNAGEGHLQQMAERLPDLAVLFTLERYARRIREEIIEAVE